MYDYLERDVRDGAAVQILGTNRPESPQAWTVTAALAVKWWYGGGHGLHGHGRTHDGRHWRDALDAAVSGAMPGVEALQSSGSIQSAWNHRGDFTVNLSEGKRMDGQARETRRGGEPVSA